MIMVLVDVDVYVVTTHPTHIMGHLCGLCLDDGVGRCGWMCGCNPPNP